jgi:hypothetical protein
MLEQLFGSRTRVKLLQLFLLHPTERFFVRELTRKANEHINSVRRELAHLTKIGLLTTESQDRKKFYLVKHDFILFEELKALMFKARLLSEKETITQIKDSGEVRYLSLMGYFMNDLSSATDLFIVGEIQKMSVEKLLEQFNNQFGHQLRFTLMNFNEYKYRREVTDKFLFTILQNPQIILHNTLTVK